MTGVGPFHLHQVLFTLIVDQVLQQVLCIQLSIILKQLIRRFLLYLLQFNHCISQEIIQQHFGKVICIEVNESASHFREH